jgi:hypothetical protein
MKIVKTIESKLDFINDLHEFIDYIEEEFHPISKADCLPVLLDYARLRWDDISELEYYLTRDVEDYQNTQKFFAQSIQETEEEMIEDMRKNEPKEYERYIKEMEAARKEAVERIKEQVKKEKKEKEEKKQQELKKEAEKIGVPVEKLNEFLEKYELIYCKNEKCLGDNCVFGNPRKLQEMTITDGKKTETILRFCLAEKSAIKNNINEEKETENEKESN